MPILMTPFMLRFLILPHRVRQYTLCRFATFVFVGCLVFFAAPALADSHCTIQNVDERQKVVYVHDGDTLWLEDGNKVRIIGLNAPEVPNRHKQRAAEPFGLAARDALRERLTEQTILLDFDEKKLDRYKRLLAHVFFSDGSSVAEWLLAQGLGQAAPVGPNFEYLDCYTRADRKAQTERLGLWGDPHFAAKPAEQLSEADGGFMLVRGCVHSLAAKDDYYYVYLSDAFRLKMDQSLPALQARQCLTVRGWVYNSRSKRYPGKGMTVFHKAAIENIHAAH